MNDKMLSCIKKYLKKKKEEVIIDLIIKDYNKCNFYIALIFVRKIEKFKVLYIPIDIVLNYKIENFVCYQFININSVNYILETLNINRHDLVLDMRNKNICSYYIEINFNIGSDSYCLKATKSIPKEWQFMFDIIAILFEHVPNIMGELCNELLAVLSNDDFDIKYNKSLDFDLFNGDLNALLPNVKKQEVSIDFLEKVNGRYFSIVNDSIVIVDYNNGKKILNLYCSLSNDDIDSYFYKVLESIRNCDIKKFYKIEVYCDDFERRYLCCGFSNKGLKVIEGDSYNYLSIDLIVDGKLKFISDVDDDFLSEIKKYLVNRFDYDKVCDIMKYINNK